MSDEEVREPAAFYSATVADVLERYPLPVSADNLRDSVKGIGRQISAYEAIVRQFGDRHGCALEAFEARISEGEVP
jgi:hypothetical protein